MAWSFSDDLGAFREAALPALAEDPVRNAVLLGEADWLGRRPGGPGDARFGWWTEDDGWVGGGFLRAPGHRPLLTIAPDAALRDLASRDAKGLRFAPFDVDAAVAAAAVQAWADAGIPLVERERIRTYRLWVPTAAEDTDGAARTATGADRALLLDWFRALKAAHPGDDTEPEYAVDEPLERGAVVLWEVGGRPVATASFSRPVAGVVRLSGPYPADDVPAGRAAFAAACAAARDVAHEVLVLGAASDDAGDARYRSLGFRVAGERVRLAFV